MPKFFPGGGANFPTTLGILSLFACHIGVAKFDFVISLSVLYPFSVTSPACRALSQSGWPVSRSLPRQIVETQSRRHSKRWLDQIRDSRQRFPADVWRDAVRRGPPGATQRTLTTTRWWRISWATWSRIVQAVERVLLIPSLNFDGAIIMANNGSKFTPRSQVFHERVTDCILRTVSLLCRRLLPLVSS